jgi:hypothetical protein
VEIINMLTIDGNHITLTHGDSFEGTLSIKVGTQAYTPQAGDVIKFYMRNIYQDDEAVITKTVNTSSLKVVLTPADVEDLPCRSYLYQVKLTRDGDTTTFIEGIIELTEDAAHA